MYPEEASAYLCRHRKTAQPEFILRLEETVQIAGIIAGLQNKAGRVVDAWSARQR